MKNKISLIMHNVRSAHNVGSILRTAEGLGIDMVYMSGYTPYPMASGEKRLLHIAKRVDRQIAKTALGAEKLQAWQVIGDIEALINKLEKAGWLIAGLEQTSDSVKITDFKPPSKILLVVGNELEGIERNLLKKCRVIVEIPMQGKKESYNVAEAAAIAMFYCRHYPFK